MEKAFFYLITIIFFVFPYELVFAVDLNLNGQNNQIYENQTYETLTITNSNNITIRNCKFASNSGNVVTISDSSNIRIEGSDISGLIDACNGISISNTSYVNVTNCIIHNLADDGVTIWNSNHLYFTDNEIYTLYGIGTDTGGTCYNGHSDGFELFNVSDSEFIGNLVYDVRSTSAFFMGGIGTSQNITLKNNIFYTPESGFVVYVWHADGVKMYNNTFWQGQYGGIAIGDSVNNLEIYNNITHSINYDHFNGSQEEDHYIDYNLIGIPGQGYTLHNNDDVDVTPFTDIAGIGGPVDRDINAYEFTLKETSLAIDNGTIGADVPTTDHFNNPRSGVPDIGAIEYVAGNDTTPPMLSEIKVSQLTENSGLISWISNEHADSQVEYGFNQSYGLSTVIDNNLQTVHSVELINLNHNTLYHYRVKSSDSSGNLTVSNDFVFTTFDEGQIAKQFTVSDVVASSHDGNIPENTLDDNLETRWSAEGYDQWIEYDLGSENRVTQLSIAFYLGNQRVTQFEIQVSSDHNSWNTVFEGSSGGTTLEREQFEIPGSLARYVRILGHGNSVNNWNSLTEVSVLGVISVTPPEVHNFQLFPILSLLLLTE